LDTRNTQPNFRAGLNGKKTIKTLFGTKIKILSILLRLFKKNYLLKVKLFSTNIFKTKNLILDFNHIFK